MMRRGLEPPDALAAEGAAEATSLWAVGQYDGALQTLQRMEGLLPDDKVQLNAWVAGFYADPAVSIDDITARFRAWLESHTPGDSPTHSGYAVAAINYAVLLFVQQQHASMLAVLEPLYSQVDALHGGLALCLCVLLLEVYLSSRQLAKAAAVLQYLQAWAAPDTPLRSAAADDDAVPGDQAASSSGGGGHSEQQPPPGEPPLTEQQQQQQQQAGSPGDRQAQQSSPQQHKQQASPPSEPAQPATPSQQPQQQQDADAGPSSGACSLNLPIVSRITSDFMQQVGQLVEQQGGQLERVDVTALLHLYKARLAMACNNLRAARPEVRALLVLQPSSAAAVLLKAQLELLRQQPRKALKTLGPLMSGTQGATSRGRLQLLNVLAAVHHQLGKHNVAALYLHAAMLQHERDYQQQLGRPTQQQPDASEQQPEPAKQLGMGSKPANRKAAAAADSSAEPPVSAAQREWLLPDMSDGLAFNMGLQQLALHNWQAALNCFDAASSKYYNQPQLWLRMAEASLNLFNEQQDEQQQHQCQQQVEVLLLPQERLQQSQQLQPQQQQQHTEGAQSSDTAAPSAGAMQLLHQAASQLNTGLMLLQQQQAEAAKQAEAALAASLAEGGSLEASQNGLLHPGAAAAIASGSYLDAAGSSSAAAGPSQHEQQQLQHAFSALDVGHSSVMPHDVVSVKQALLANSAYVQLLLGNPSQALSAAQALLACSSMSRQQHYLGTCYAAEALCLLHRPDEATEQLQSHMALFMDTGPSGSGSSSAHNSSAAPPAAAAGAATPGPAGAPPAAQQDGLSIKSDDDGSCAGFRGSGSHQQSPSSSVAPQQQAALLCNLASLLAAQGDKQESRRLAALAAQQDPSNAVARQLLGVALTN